MPPSPQPSFSQVLSAAIDDMVAHGFDSVERVDRWSRELEAAARRSMASEAKMDEMLRGGLAAIYRRMVERDGLLRRHDGVSRFTLAQVKPKLRAELDRRIMASAQLIRLNRQQAVQKTLQRFQGWSTSIPKGGTDVADRGKTRKDVRKALASLPFEERRVLIDQGHKFTAALSGILAADGGAIALTWHSHWRQANYDYREDHKERDGKVYAIRDSWALMAGLMKRGPNPYYDEITAVGEEVFCRCYAQYLYNLRDLPADMVTAKGRGELEAAKAARGAA